MKPIFTKTIRMHKNGRITIPKSIRDMYGLPEKVTFEIRLLGNDTIELVPEAPYRQRFLKKLQRLDAEGCGSHPARG